MCQGHTICLWSLYSNGILPAEQTQRCHGLACWMSILTFENFNFAHGWMSTHSVHISHPLQMSIRWSSPMPILLKVCPWTSMAHSLHKQNGYWGSSIECWWEQNIMTAKERIRQKVEDTILKYILTKYLSMVRMSHWVIPCCTICRQ